MLRKNTSKDSLIYRVAKAVSCHPDDSVSLEFVDKVITEFLSQLFNDLKAGIIVRIVNFGTFTPKRTPRREYKMPDSRKVKAEGRKIVSFKVTKKINRSE